MILWLAVLLLADRVSIVESHQPFTISSMQSQRIVQTVRFLRCRRHLPNHEANPMPSFGVDDKCEAVEVKQRIESGIVLPHTSLMLSVHHNVGNNRLVEEQERLFGRNPFCYC